MLTGNSGAAKRGHVDGIEAAFWLRFAKFPGWDRR